MNRILSLAAAVGAHLKEFAEIDLREDSGNGCEPSLYSKPYFPKLYLNGRKDKALLTMPGEGRALVRYKVQRRNIDETREDGPRYGADIEVQSIEPVPEEASAELARADFLREFGFKPRTATQLLKTSKRNPLKISKDGFGEFKVHPKGKPSHGGSYFTNDVKDARATAADMIKRNRKRVRDGAPGFFSAAGRLHEFAGERDRDEAGRFATGQVAKPEDFMLAQKKKPGLLKKAAAATALTGAGAGLLALKYRKRI